jgi:hypothetical protein
MGANMTPTMKKSGRTVFGVRMGLLQRCQRASHAVCPACTHTAMPSIVAAGTRYLCAVSMPVRVAVVPVQRLLGGRRLFVFLGSSRAGSWLDIEFVCATCCVCDIASVPRCSAGAMVVEERSLQSSR